MDWINEPEEGVPPACGNFSFSALACFRPLCLPLFSTIRFLWIVHAVRRAQTVQRYFGQQRLRGDVALQYGGGEPTLPITPHNCHVVPFY